MKAPLPLLLVVLLASLAPGCADGDSGVEPVASTSCAKLLYEGEGEPDVIVVSDLPLRGIGGKTNRLMVDTIEFVLRQRNFEAGEHRVGYQSCNDTIGEEPFDEGCAGEMRRRTSTHPTSSGSSGPGTPAVPICRFRS